MSESFPPSFVILHGNFLDSTFGFCSIQHHFTGGSSFTYRYTNVYTQAYDTFCLQKIAVCFKAI